MKTYYIYLFLIIASLSHGQTPHRDISKRDIGPSGNGAVDVDMPDKPTEVNTITHFVLVPERQWTSSDGKKLMAKLIAFEDLSVNATAPPAHPTVVKGESIRLLIGKKNNPTSRLAAVT